MKKISLFSLVFVFCLGCLFFVGCSQDEEDAILVSSIVVSTTDNVTTIKAGETLSLNCEVLPSNAENKKVLWTSSNVLVATVSDGIVTAIDEGEVVITASAQDSSKVIGQITLAVTNPKDSYASFNITTDVVDGYTVNNNIYTFTTAGEYTVSGLLEGALVFDSSLEEKVTLNLNGVYIENANGSAIYWQSENSKIEIKTVSETVNYLIEGNYESEDSSGALNSENNIEIGGSGVLYINSKFKHAVKGSEITVKGSVELHLTADSDGLHGKTIIIEGGVTYIDNCSDAIQAELNSKGNKGTVSITDGTLVISNCECAIKVDTSITVEGENVVITMTSIEEEVFDYPVNGLKINSGTITVDGENYPA